MAGLRKISIIGSGNWGSTIAKIIGTNVQGLKSYDEKVRMWVFEEEVNGRKLTEIINSDHENVKYLAGIKLPPNVVANSNLSEVTCEADVLVFVLPHQFIERICQEMKPFVKKGAYGVSLMKGLAISKDKKIMLLTDLIRHQLAIPCGVLMGANLAIEVSLENYCEATIGAADDQIGKELKQLFQTDYFRIVVIRDEVGAELCGALKNIIAVGAGLIEGLGYGNNTKAAAIRLGFMELKTFIYHFFKERDPEEGTFLESCGVADLITTCYGGRNKQIGIALTKSKKSLHDLELELLNGQSAQGPLTAAEVHATLKEHDLLNEYPLFTAVHRICTRQLEPAELISCLMNHPQHR